MRNQVKMNGFTTNNMPQEGRLLLAIVDGDYHFGIVSGNSFRFNVSDNDPVSYTKMTYWVYADNIDWLF